MRSSGVHSVMSHSLVANLCWNATVSAEDPFRMRAVQVRVHVDHLTLKPQPELHSGCGYALDDRSQSLGPYLRVDHPVAEICVVVTAASKPTIVKNETFNTDLGCGIHEGTL